MKKLRELADKPLIGGLVKKAISTLASNDANHISEHFSQYLRPQIAASEALKHEVFRLRHNVYCEELHFEEIKPDYEEYDEFDAHSIHCFIRHLASGQLAGTVRLIQSQAADQLLPIEKFCSHAIDDPVFRPDNFPRESICEISRLAVPHNFRKRAIDNFSGAATGVINEAVFSKTELRCFPYIAICLYMSAMAMAMHEKRYHGFVMMEPRLARSLSFVGIKFKQIGKLIDFHGLRAPFYLDGRQLNQELSSGYLKLLEAVERDLFNPSTEISVPEPSDPTQHPFNIMLPAF